MLKCATENSPLSHFGGGGNAMVGKMKIVNDNLLEIISSPEYAELSAMFHERRYRKKEIIFHPNHAEDTVFVVKKGRVRVFLTFNDKEFTLSILEAGDVYTTHTRAFTQALDDCALLVCSTKDFGKMIMDYPAFTLNIINVLGDLLKNSITIITNLAFKESDMRLKEYLLACAQEKGIACEHGTKVEIGQDIGQIAMMIGVSRQTVSAIMNELYRLDVLERLDRTTIIIKDLDALIAADKNS
jgi:CRP-like cAMP-binding protein